MGYSWQVTGERYSENIFWTALKKASYRQSCLQKNECLDWSAENDRQLRFLCQAWCGAVRVLPENGEDGIMGWPWCVQAQWGGDVGTNSFDEIRWNDDGRRFLHFQNLQSGCKHMQNFTFKENPGFICQLNGDPFITLVDMGQQIPAREFNSGASIAVSWVWIFGGHWI